MRNVRLQSLSKVLLHTSFTLIPIRTMSTLIQIDGSLGEGGGQVLRVALCLSALYKIPIKINNIRAGRSKPGLAAQHLKGIELLKDMCDAEILGAHIGSTTLEFKPGQLKQDKQTFFVDIGTAGCICLLAQVSLPCALFLPQGETVRLILKGGTNVPMGPHIEYLTEVLRPLLNKFGADFDFRVVTRGYYPKGGGEVHLYVKPVHTLKAITLTDPGIAQEILGWAYVAGVVPIREAYKMENDAKSVLTDGLNKHNITLPNINIESYKEDRNAAIGNGSGINLVCTTSSGCIFGGSGLGSNKRDEQTAPGIQAANEILDTILSKSCVDEHAQDQLIIFMALAKGTSKVNLGSKKLTCHTETAIQVAEIMLKEFNLHFKLSEGKDNGGNISYSLECKGYEYENKIK
ncbi:RNA 3'-terminal phosphate cyclase-like isoform X2 [Ceratina calcarata]|uniref:RNA 3'-terminal phosphate cyclase n=1 Tax=Ceratina calcarata TaxID=156304 RepID=A0AAJ7NBC7_9HYME|nr:RNA 3'-terminal phosphate cyclase-like isoform X2 [Ceratina calcarata]XP_017886986.1 RNA 3'-terminal phosphate cyclase-like isoform X2 [Ceratina calcarata]